MMVMCNKQHLSYMWDWIREKFKQHWGWIKKALLIKKLVLQLNKTRKLEWTYI